MHSKIYYTSRRCQESYNQEMKKNADGFNCLEWLSSILFPKKQQNKNDLSIDKCPVCNKSWNNNHTHEGRTLIVFDENT